jgi:hypothetical protein
MRPENAAIIASWPKFELSPEHLAAGWRPHDGGPCPLKQGVPYQVMEASGHIRGVATRIARPEWFNSHWVRAPRRRIVAYLEYAPVKPAEVAA